LQGKEEEKQSAERFQDEEISPQELSLADIGERGEGEPSVAQSTCRRGPRVR